MKTWYKVKIDWVYDSVTYKEYHMSRTAAIIDAMLNFFCDYLLENHINIAQLKITADFADCYNDVTEEGEKE
jgi:hypothetical protein